MKKILNIHLLSCLSGFQTYHCHINFIYYLVFFCFLIVHYIYHVLIYEYSIKFIKNYKYVYIKKIFVTNLKYIQLIFFLSSIT